MKFFLFWLNKKKFTMAFSLAKNSKMIYQKIVYRFFFILVTNLEMFNDFTLLFSPEIWCLATSDGSAVWFEPYCGRDTLVNDVGLGQGPNVVLDLLHKVRFSTLGKC